jgi:hypothetical protein
MSTVPSSLRLPRPGVAALVALVGGVAIAVELLVPAPRSAAKLSSIVACPPRLAGDTVRIGCRATIMVLEIDRGIDPAFSRPPPNPAPAGQTTTPRIRNLGPGSAPPLRPR